jgi:glycosyltransferase involved in cell wall biosynthesis
MSYTNKRIALVVARNNFIHRGVGSYSKSILDWALSNGHTIDIISDDHVRDNGLFDQYADRVNWITPENIINDKIYKEITAFKFGYNMAASLNFRNSLFRALKKYTYDLMIPNSNEALMAIMSMGMHRVTTVLYPTHGGVEAGIEKNQSLFAAGITDVFVGLNGVPKVLLACQSDWVREHTQALYPAKADECITVGPMVPELGLLDFDRIDTTKQWGVGFIGPWEGDKNPEAYIRALKASGLPAVVICPSDVSEKKFRKAFEDAGIEFKIHVGVTGQEKTEIIRTFAAAYHPSVTETFGLGVLETAHVCPTVLLSKNKWSVAHRDYCIIHDETAVPEILKKMYGKGVFNQQALLDRHQKTVDVLNGLLNREKLPRKNKNSLTEAIDDKSIIKQEEFTNELPSFCSDEFYKLARMTYQQEVEVLHTKDSTFFRVAGSGAVPEEKEDIFSSLFN